LRVAQAAGALRIRDLKRVTVDTTVQPKAITFPTDAKLLHAAVKGLVRLAKKHGVQLRQSYLRIAKHAALMAGRYAHGKQFKHHHRQVCLLRTRLGRIIRDIRRKISIRPEIEAVFQWPLHAKVLPGNPYDGHTLSAVIEDTERHTGCAIERAYVDKGYRGHTAPNQHRVFISGQKRGVFDTIKRELRRRSAIEAVIGHMKTDEHLGRCYLKGSNGDAANAILTAFGYNLRLILAWLRILLCLIMLALCRAIIGAPARQMGFLTDDFRTWSSAMKRYPFTLTLRTAGIYYVRFRADMRMLVRMPAIIYHANSTPKSLWLVDGTHANCHATVKPPYSVKPDVKP
jgi:transposase, IS5 family